MVIIENDIGQISAEPKEGIGGWLGLFQIRLMWTLYHGANDLIFLISIAQIVVWFGLLVCAALFYKGFMAFRIIYTVVFGVNVFLILTTIAWGGISTWTYSLIAGMLSMVIDTIIVIALLNRGALRTHLNNRIPIWFGVK